MSATERSQAFKNLSGGNLDAWRGPYATKAAACTAIPNEVDGDGRNLREGKFVEIGTAESHVTHWWKGGFADENLVEYTTGKVVYPAFSVNENMELIGSTFDGTDLNFELNNNSELILNIQ